MRKGTILLGLNELNIDFIKFYSERGLLPNFNNLLENGYVETTSENEYKLLEPWIQWVTVYTGKTYEEHKVFRLGDIVERGDLTQIFEELEAENFSIGAVSPFNAANRLKKATFFIPDPWTETTVVGSKLVEKLYAAIHQLVNDNAQSKINASSIFALLRGLQAYVPLHRYTHYISLGKDIRKPGIRAIILDNLLSDVFLNLWNKNKPDFSYLFLNAGAHIQHHYLYNSKAYNGPIKNPEWYCHPNYDPLFRVLKEYDFILGKLLQTKERVLVCTGLHQVPHNHLTYYWRLINHSNFLHAVGISNFSKVQPRMSRDFLVEFTNEQDCTAAERILESLLMHPDKEPVFSIDNRGKSLFIELVYPNNISDDMYIYNSDLKILKFKKYVAFVAIKNGEHHGTGYLLGNVPFKEKKIPLTQVYHFLKQTVKNEYQ